MMKTIEIIIITLLMIFCASACVKTELEDSEFSWCESGVAQDELGIISLKMQLPFENGEVKSRFPDKVESVLSGLSVGVYRSDKESEDWQLVTQQFTDSALETMKFKLNSGFRYKLFAVSNIWEHPGNSPEDFFAFPESMNELFDKVFVLGQGENMTFSDVAFRGIPSSGSSGELSLLAGESVDCNVTMSLLFAKIEFNVNRCGYTSDCVNPTGYFGDSRIILSNLNANVCPFPSDSYEMEFSDCGEMEYELNCQGTQMNNSYVFYVPANVHGLEGSRCKAVSDGWMSEIADLEDSSEGEPVDDVKPQLTKLVFRGEFKPDSGYVGFAEYLLYPGGSLEPYSIESKWYRDFNLLPGCRYVVNLSFRLSTLMNRLEPYWQLDVTNFEDCRYFGLRWAQSRESGAQYLIRGSHKGDNTIDGSVKQLVVARPESPAELGLWYSTQGAQGAASNDFSIPQSMRKAGCPVLGSPLFFSASLMDNCFYVSLTDKTTSEHFLYSGDRTKSLPSGLDLSFDNQDGKLTINCSGTSAGKEYDCTIHFLPGDNNIPFTLRCLPDISVSSDSDELYVGQKTRVSISGASADYSLTGDMPGILKLSALEEDEFIGSSGLPIGESSFLYAWNSTGNYDMNLTFIPSDSLNDPKIVKTVKVLLPGVRRNADNVNLTIDGRGNNGPMRYVKMDESETTLEYGDFDPELFAKTIAPVVDLTRNGLKLHPKASAALFEDGGLSWYSGTADGFEVVESACGLVETGYDAVVAPPKKYYGGVEPFKAKLRFAIPKISDRWMKQTDTTLFYDSVIAADAIKNSLETFNRFGNKLDFSKSGPNSSGVQLAESEGSLIWSFKDSGLSVSSLNTSPFGKQGARLSVTNVRDGSVWSKSLQFTLYHKFTVNVYAYFAVEDRSVPNGYTSRFNESGVFLMTPRHWRLMQDIWLNSKNYWKKSSISMGDISAAGISLSKFILLSTSWMYRSDCYHEGNENQRYWQTNDTYYNFEQGFLYVSNIGRDDIWGWKENGASKYRYQYYYGEYFNEKNVKSVKPVYNAYYYDGYNRLSYDEYIMRLGNEYVVINNKSNNVFKDTFTLWLGERSR